MAGSSVDPYATLGIPASATRAEAARAHRRLAKEFHPDVNPGPAAADQMRRINAAWRILSNPALRSRYDADRRPGSWAEPAYRSGASTATWTTWPESRHSAMPRTRRPPGADPVKESYGDRPAVFIGVWVLLTLLFFIGSWLGSLTP